MKIISELTNQEYNSVEACLEAEAVWMAEKQAEEEAAQAKENEYNQRKAEVDEAYNTLQNARLAYNELVSAFLSDYGFYHSNGAEKETTKMLENLFDNVWNFFK